MKTKAQEARKAGKDGRQGKGESSFFCFSHKTKSAGLVLLEKQNGV
jgi:hypothetical protein